MLAKAERSTTLRFQPYREGHHLSTSMHFAGRHLQMIQSHTVWLISSLQGVLDLSNPVTDILNIKIDAGMYKVYWRLQFFDSSWSTRDARVIREGMGTTHHDYRGNPMNFPTWHKNPRDEELRESIHDSPSRPAFCLSAGYRKRVLPINFDELSYGPAHDLLAHQILMPAETNPNVPDAKTRVDYWIQQEESLVNRDKGWVTFCHEVSFEVVKGRQPTFVVCAIDSGNWLGGFRFGGIHLERVKTSA